MEPDEVAEKTLIGIKRNDFHIFTHPEFKEELKGVFDATLAALPDGQADPARLAFEEGRRRTAAEVLAKWGLPIR